MGCAWEWLGIRWGKLTDACPPETPCAEPTGSGAYVGQVVYTPCGGD